MKIPDREVARLTGHGGTEPGFGPNPSQILPLKPRSLLIVEQKILTGSSDRSIRLYNPAKSFNSTPGSGLVQTYSAHGYEVFDLSITEDNARFASVGGDKQVFLWDVATARTLKRWPGHFGRVNCVGFGGEEGNVVVSGSFDATVRLWDCKSQSTKPIQIFEDSKDSVSSLHVLGHEIVTGSVDGKMRLYDLRMGMIYVDTIGRKMIPQSSSTCPIPKAYPT
ncbi:MAG: hypothetical protein L6R40_003772 [Gallowayella cf. fulva]|nr:MAG: hypothetical protein L6R40_003772 [Xanthomendoza cf. fulva]